MANLKDIRDRIKSVKAIQQVTSAMKMVAAAKLRRAQERMEQARPYSKRLQGVIENLLPDVDRGMFDLLEMREVSVLGIWLLPPTAVLRDRLTPVLSRKPNWKLQK